MNRKSFDLRATPLERMRAIGARMTERSKPPTTVQISDVSCAFDNREIRGEWLQAGADKGVTILYVHSGGFCLEYGAPHRGLAARLAVGVGARTFALRYRLAPEHPYPAGIDDCVAAYEWLLRETPPERLIVGGDSAGATLCLESLIRLRGRGKPMPAAAFLLCPMGLDLEFSADSYKEVASKDRMNSVESMRPYAALYGRRTGSEVLNEDLSGLPPTFIQGGGDEVLRGDWERLERRLTEAGGEARLSIWPGMWHTFQCFAPWVPEAQQGIDEVVAFIKAHVRANH
ncbi:alpha/beta hydrolase [Sorangium sp. So ce726]|uniref:alpha/beta hydrolase n=1 Tax=Sorangium sp. So ce726 TaxID=3133319 RepID=UPI003F614797